jgi:RNA polymerase sigma factor (sigma-70 family)
VQRLAEKAEEERMSVSLIYKSIGKNEEFDLVEPFAAISDDQLVVAAKDGDRLAFGELVRRHADKVLHMTLRITRNREDAEDAAQECFVSALVHLKAFDRRSQFSTWLTRIAINAALLRLRRDRKRREVSINEPRDEDETSLSELVESSASPEQCYWEKERSALVRNAIGLLRPRLRLMIETHHREDGSLFNAAKILGISAAAAKGRLFRAKEELRRSLGAPPRRAQLA